jgi:hypothetical protein
VIFYVTRRRRFEMKKVFVLSFVLLLISTFSFAANFAPTPMRLIGPDNVNYAFDGSPVDIPITVTGAPVFMRFFVYTKGKAAEINDIRNGHLGWHYMNKIDTCIYQSGDYKFTPGSNTVTWSGKDNDGGKVPDGAYTYYLWGFDDLTPRTKGVPAYIVGNEYGDRTREEFLHLDEAGIALAAPVWKHRYFRWIMGSDPEDQIYLKPLHSIWARVGATSDLVSGFITLPTGVQFMLPVLMQRPQPAKV